MRGLCYKSILCAAAFLLPNAGIPASFIEVEFANIQGWALDDHAPALEAFQRGCDSIRSTSVIPRRDWDRVCALARTGAGPARAFFEQNFTPVIITTGSKALFTGYFEPALRGSKTRTERFRYPLYTLPPEIEPGQRWNTRAEIENGLLEGRGLELVWLDNQVDAFFVHVQGSARISLQDGSLMRVGFAGRNGQRFRSVGRELVRLGTLRASQTSMQGIKDWAAENPDAATRALQYNPSFIFFRALDLPDDLGPLGALQVPLTPLRSIAVDPAFTPLGAPVWVRMEAAGNLGLDRLMVAQDTGSAIKGAQRADIYYGTGVEAGLEAGKIRYFGEIITLLPNNTAARLRDH